MRSCSEMRRDAWSILKGKWFWRMLIVATLLQLMSSVVNGLLSSAYAALSITTVADYVGAKIEAMQHGISCSLPTAKAYGWMIGGFALQMFIGYIFAAIFAFGFMGLILKATNGDDSRWFEDSFGGFARPLEITWLLALMNLLAVLAGAAWGIVFGVCAVAAVHAAGVELFSPVGYGCLAGAVVVSTMCALPVVYAYRQSWFVKNERPDASAVECLRASRCMMKGFKWRAFMLDLSFSGWIAAAFGILLVFALSVPMAVRICGQFIGGFAYFAFGIFAFWVVVRVLLGMAVSRAVFYRELQGLGSKADEEDEA